MRMVFALPLGETDWMTEIVQAWHGELTAEQLAGLRALFDAEYFRDSGAWNPAAPYGYSPAELHTIAVTGDGTIVGHVGTQRRHIHVGGRPVTVAGTGGVLVSPSRRGTGLGQRLVAAAQRAGRTSAPAEYGYLGCREDIVPFYLSCGYVRVHATERCLSRLDRATAVESTDAPCWSAPGPRMPARGRPGSSTSAAPRGEPARVAGLSPSGRGGRGRPATGCSRFRPRS